MDSIKQYNALHGKSVNRTELQKLIALAKSENQKDVYKRLNGLLSNNPDITVFNITIKNPIKTNDSKSIQILKKKRLELSKKSNDLRIKRTNYRKGTKAYNDLQSKIDALDKKRDDITALLGGKRAFSKKKDKSLNVPSKNIIYPKGTTIIGLGAPRHSGIAQNALNECGRLLPGFKFIKGGEIVKIQPKKTESKTPSKLNGKLDKFQKELELFLKSQTALQSQIDVIDKRLKEISDIPFGTLNDTEQDKTSKERSKLFKEKFELKEKQSEEIIKQGKLLNAIRALSLGGEVTDIKDKKGKTHQDVADFRPIQVNDFVFDESTVLEDEIPPYIPLFDEKTLERKGFVFDAIEIEADSYLVATREHSEDKLTEYVILTLDQLVLTSDYFVTRTKAKYKKDAERRNERALEHWDGLPETKKQQFYEVNRASTLYKSLPAQVKKKITLENYEKLDWKGKEKVYKFYKRYGSKRIKSKLDEKHMWVSTHKMYERFINPKATQPKRGYANPEVFEYWRKFRQYLEYKILDINIQRSDYSELRNKALETSFGDTNVSKALLKEHGILVKRQNGDVISPKEIEEIKTSWVDVKKTFGDITNLAKDFGLKVSHTGKKLVFARKAVGIFIPNYNSIAVSAKYSSLDFSTTMAHEIAHFLDYSLGQQKGKRFESDNYESNCGILAKTFRANMNGKDHSDYTNSTKECFARALEQYFAIENYGNDVILFFNEMSGPTEPNTRYLEADNFVGLKAYNDIIKPLVKTVLKDVENRLIKGKGLAAPRHEGIAKEALTDCGRLKPGYKYLKGGKIVKVENENKTSQIFDFKDGEIVFVAYSKNRKSKIDVEYKINKNGGYYSWNANGSGGSANNKYDISKEIKRQIEYLGKGYFVRLDKLDITPKSKRHLNTKNSEGKEQEFLIAYNESQETGSLTLDQNQDKGFIDFFFKEIYKRNLKPKKIFVAALEESLLFDVSSLKKSTAPKVKPGIESLKIIVSKDDLRPVLGGVYTDEGNLVATNAHILVILKGIGKKADEGKILNTFNIVKDKRKYIDGTYPKYKNVIPTYKNQTDFIDIDLILNDVYTLIKLTRPIKSKITRFLIVDNKQIMGYDANYLLSVLKVLKANGAKKIKYAGHKNRALVINADNGNLGLVMPIMIYANNPKELSKDFILNKPINYSDKGYNEMSSYGLSGKTIQKELFSIPQKKAKTKSLGTVFIDVNKPTATPQVVSEGLVTQQPLANVPIYNAPEENTQPIADEQPAPTPKPNTNTPKGVISTTDLMNMKFDTIQLTGPFSDFMQDPAKNMRVGIFGRPKNGKTAGSTALANELTKHGTVLYNFVDQGLNKSTQKLWELSGLAQKPNNAFLTDTRDLDQLEKLCASGKYDYVFIDMINNYIHLTGIKYHEFESRFLKKYPNISFILVFESTKSGDFKGDQGWTHIIDQLVNVEDFVMHSSGRYGVGDYVVWKEGLAKVNPKKFAEYFTEEVQTPTQVMI